MKLKNRTLRVSKWCFSTSQSIGKSGNSWQAENMLSKIRHRNTKLRKHVSRVWNRCWSGKCRHRCQHASLDCWNPHDKLVKVILRVTKMHSWICFTLLFNKQDSFDERIVPEWTIKPLNSWKRFWQLRKHILKLESLFCPKRWRCCVQVFIRTKKSYETAINIRSRAESCHLERSYFCYQEFCERRLGCAIHLISVCTFPRETNDSDQRNRNRFEIENNPNSQQNLFYEFRTPKTILDSWSIIRIFRRKLVHSRSRFLRRINHRIADFQTRRSDLTFFTLVSFRNFQTLLSDFRTFFEFKIHPICAV